MKGGSDRLSGPRTPDPGLRTPDPGFRTPDCRTGSDTDPVAATATGAIGLVTGVSSVPFSGDYSMDQGPPVEA